MPASEWVAEVPGLLAEWDTERNLPLDPATVRTGSDRRVWWRCGLGHRWDANVSMRYRYKTACPFCSGRRATDVHNLAVAHPDLVSQWHPTRNGGLRPDQVLPASSRRVWWRCPGGHDWRAVVSSRTRQETGCPVCSGRRAAATYNLAVLFPAVAATWDTARNSGVRPEDVSPYSNRRAAWQCSLGHEWSGKVLDRTQYHDPGCPFCADKKLVPSNSLAVLNPEVAAQWHPDRNGSLTPMDVRPASTNRAIYWLCPRCGHSWRTSPRRRAVEGTGCPECARAFPRRAREPLTVTHPELAAQWHPDHNGVRTPDQVTYGSGREVWWCCAEGHAWETSVRNRQRHGCPYCSGRLPTADNNLAVLNPELAAQWHPDRNGELTPEQVTPRSSAARVWWRCPKGHDWQAPVRNRAYGKGCPYCSGRLPTADNNLAVLNPELAAQWHPDRNGELTPEQVTPAAPRRVWWHCPRCGHDWHSKILNRAHGTGCPACATDRSTTQHLR